MRSAALSGVAGFLVDHHQSSAALDDRKTAGGGRSTNAELFLQGQHGERGLGRFAALILARLVSARKRLFVDFSTVRMPLPIARPSRVSAMMPRALSFDTTSK